VHLTGRKYLKVLRPYLHRLHAAYHHPLRVLFYDDVLISYLVAFFNPAVRSLRLIEDASQVPGINQFLNVRAVCSSTLSDANALFDPVHLSGLIAELRAALPASTSKAPPGSEEAKLIELLDKAVLVDGSFFRLASDVQWAIHAANQYGGGKSSAKPGIGTVRFNCQFCLKEGVPGGVSINGSDGVHESTAAAAFVQGNQLYVFDSGIVSFDHLRAIIDAGSHLVCNLCKTVNFTVTRERELTQQDKQAGIISDRVGYLSGSHRNTPPDAVFREIIVQYTDRNGEVRQLRLLTNLLELSAFNVAELYRQRWKIELFFRWLKVSANFTHLCSHNRNGVALAFHVAVIAALLMVLRSGRELSVYGYNLLSMVAAGLADVDDILPILEKRDRERRLERERLARKRAAKKSA
jgi:hypothetical protein